MARLAIADPPYLGTASLYGTNPPMLLGNQTRGGGPNRRRTGDGNQDAWKWDDPSTHKALVERLVDEYDRWVVSMSADSLFEYLHWVPRDTRIAAWSMPDPMPVGRLIKSWQPCLVYAPGLPRVKGREVRDSLFARKTFGPSTERFVGRKPPLWTRWVLDMLGYDPDADTVDDLFSGSGAVTAEINQGVLV